MRKYKTVYDLCIVISRDVKYCAGSYCSVEDTRIVIATLNHNPLFETQTFTWFDYKDYTHLINNKEIEDEVLAKHAASCLSKRIKETDYNHIDGWFEVVERLVEV